jgi:hypothetical protein
VNSLSIELRIHPTMREPFRVLLFEGSSTRTFTTLAEAFRYIEAYVKKQAVDSANAAERVQRGMK